MRMYKDETLVNSQEYHLIRCVVITGLGKKRADYNFESPYPEQMYSLCDVVKFIAKTLSTTVAEVDRIITDCGVYGWVRA